MSTPTAAASEELICSICLGAFHCPSTLSCGHSFCLRCLEDAWQVAGRCFCPQCRAEFEQKPQLSRNVALANLVVELSVGEKAAPQVSCDSCLVGDVPAVRSCLTCEASLCESHCKRHLQNARFKDHELVELGVSVEARTCKMHKESLRFYCTQDESLVCTSCAIVGEHTGHKFSSVEDAHESRKEELRLEKTRREENKKTAASHTQSLREDYQRVQESLRGTKEGISREFERRREQLREEEREALECVYEEGRFVLSRIQADIARYESRVCSLEREINQLLAALAMQDPLSFLQDPLHEKLRSSGLQGIQDAPPPTFSHQELTEDISLGGVKMKLMALVYGRSPTLDTNSAYNYLEISSDLRTVMRTNVSQSRPHHPHRFDRCYQVLCSESFSSGQFYWEVDMGRSKGLCRIGVTYGTTPRRGRGAECGLGGNDVSWSLQKDNNSFSVWHGGVATSLSVLEPPQRVGIHLNWDAGLLSFYSADSMSLLHSVHQTFTQHLYPGLWVCGKVYDSVTIVDLSRVS
uniref:E3 ubiquitin/ISG15 ligase TRIM25-like n=1 Tax=Petromyzon marinus TaxID=7757 RepID=A0AAJ7XJ41_PETMA|nr:E3 ubiquitin/ISG15 ligase TRIM25-like [Petromyzon marinus]